MADKSRIRKKSNRIKDFTYNLNTVFLNWNSVVQRKLDVTSRDQAVPVWHLGIGEGSTRLGKSLDQLEQKYANDSARGQSVNDSCSIRCAL